MGSDAPYQAYIERGVRHRVAWRILGDFLWRWADGTWEYPSLGDAVREAGLEGIDTYVSRQKNTVAHYIATRPILDLCLEAERRPGS